MRQTLTTRATAGLSAAAAAVALATLPAAGVAATTAAEPFDLDGDGRVDVVAGIPAWDREGASADEPAPVTDSGAVLVQWGGRDRTVETLITQTSPGVPGDPEAGDAFGAALASADFDRDGYADLAVGAPGDAAEPTSDGGRATGSVTVVYGGATGLTDRAGQVLHGAHRLFGAALVASDVTGDGYADLVVGSPGDDPEAGAGDGSGAVVVLVGGPDGFSHDRSYVVSRPNPATVSFGSVLAAGDVDGDGDVDVVEGYGGRMRWVAGTPYVFGHSSYLEGRPGGPTTARPLDGHNASSLAVGDVTGDGLDDIVVGTAVSQPYRAGTRVPRGRVTLFRGSVDGPVRQASVDQDSVGVPGRETSGDRFGASVDLTDIDRDGRLDVLVGAPGEDRGAGRLTILRGARTGFATRHNVIMRQGRLGIPGKAEPGDRFGAEVSVSDVNGDGRQDLVIGSPGENRSRGTVTVVRLRGIFYVPSGVRSYSLGSFERADGGGPKLFGSVLGG